VEYSVYLKHGEWHWKGVAKGVVIVLSTGHKSKIRAERHLKKHLEMLALITPSKDNND
jgi:hypothetical protein